MIAGTMDVVEYEALAAPVPQPYTVWKPSQFVAYTPPADSVILGDSVLERGKWASLVGVGGLGKTRLALWLAICQIIGQDWCGLTVLGKPLRWIILSTETGLRRWKTDLSAMLASIDDLKKATIDENLLILALTDEEEADLNTGNVEVTRRLEATLHDNKPDVVVFDPFADMVDGDENKTEDVIRTLRTLRRIVRKEVPSAAVLVIHHGRTGAVNVVQAGDNYNAGNFGRGAKALFSMVRAEIQLAPGDRDDANKIVLLCGKNSDGPKFEPRGIIFNPVCRSYNDDPEFNFEAWRADVNGKRTGKVCTVADAVEAVRQLAPVTGTEAKTGDIVRGIKDSTGAGVRTCKDRLSEAVKDGYLQNPRRGFYRLGPKPLPQ